ncbi:MAG: FAD-dependent oxidoreductase, partial [Vibrio cyclitrophicus]
MSKQKIVVVGNGMVGHKFIDNIIQADSDQYEVITFSEESRLAYDRVQLTAYFNGKTADDLALTSEAYYQENGVKYLINAQVTELDTANQTVITDSGHVESYDKLILATGSFPFVPPIPG